MKYLLIFCITVRNSTGRVEAQISEEEHVSCSPDDLGKKILERKVWNEKYFTDGMNRKGDHDDDVTVSLVQVLPL